MQEIGFLHFFVFFQPFKLKKQMGAHLNIP